MAKLLTAGELAAAGLTPELLEQYKIDRLLEMRAFIDTLRHDTLPERIADPLDWADQRHALAV